MVSPSPTLETLTLMCTLPCALSELEKDSFLSSQQIAAHRITKTAKPADGPKVDGPLYTSNFAMYSLEKKEPYLYFGGKESNPLFNNVEEVVKQFNDRESPGYKPGAEEIVAIQDSVGKGKTLKIKLSDLDLIPYIAEKPLDCEWSYFEINRRDLSNLNKSQRLLAEKVYGTDISNLTKLSTENPEELTPTPTRIYVLNPEYVKKHATVDQPIMRGCWINSTQYNSDFYITDRHAGNTKFHFSGSKKKAA